MKKAKRLLAVIAAMAMMCTMVTGWAAETLAIDSIEVLADDNSVVARYTYEDGVIKSAGAAASIEITSEQRLRVTVSMTNESEEKVSAQTTFISYKEADPQVYDDTTIQYIDQIATAVPVVVEPDEEEGEDEGIEPVTEGEETTPETTYTPAAFVFRPRSTFPLGEYAVMINAKGIDAPLTFGYTVVAPATQVSLTAAQDAVTEFEVGKAASAVVFQMNGASYPTALTEVKLGNTVLTSGSHYTYNPENGQITITVDGLNSLAVAQLYTLTVSTNENFVITALTDAVNVTPVTQPDPGPGEPDEPTVDTEIIEGAVEDVDAAVSDGGKTATFDTTVNISGEDVALTYEVAGGASLPTGVSESAEGTFTLDTAQAFAAKVTVAIKAGSTEVGQKTIYLVPDEIKETIAFGNLGLVAAANGTDAFAYDSSLSAEEAQSAFNEVLDDISPADKLADRIVALSIATGNAASDMLPHFKAALDYDKDGVLALSEYRIYKLMMDGNDPVHTFKAVNDARASWAN